MERRAKGLSFNKSLKLTIDCEIDAICCPSFLCEKMKKGYSNCEIAEDTIDSLLNSETQSQKNRNNHA